MNLLVARRQGVAVNVSGHDSGGGLIWGKEVKTGETSCHTRALTIEVRIDRGPTKRQDHPARKQKTNGMQNTRRKMAWWMTNEANEKGAMGLFKFELIPMYVLLLFI